MAIRVARILVILISIGCSGTGDKGQPCRSAGILGPWECSMGLICNEGRSPPTCETPHASRLGDRCSSEANCADGWCSPQAQVCTAFIGARGECPGGIECGPGLQCTKFDAGTPFCEALADAAAE